MFSRIRPRRCNRALPTVEPCEERSVPSASILADLTFGPAGTDIRRLVGAGDTLFFAPATVPFVGNQLWASDGTPAGTQVLGTFRSGVQSGFANGLVPLGDSLVFFANDGVRAGAQLWKSDGTAAGTTRVSNIIPVAPFWAPDTVVGVGNSRIVFTAPDLNDPSAFLPAFVGVGGVGGVGFYVDDRFMPAFPQRLTSSGRYAFFAATPARFNFSGGGGTIQPIGPRGVWRSDGTIAGTVPLALPVVPDPMTFVDTGTTTFFTTPDSLWKTDGTAAGTVQLATGLSPGPLTVSGGKVFFANSDPVFGTELWVSDGTAAGTRLVKDINDSRSSSPALLTDVGGMLFFTANDNNDLESGHGRELWRSDGTAAGTQLVLDARRGPASTTFANLTAVGGRLFYAADDGVYGSEVWQIDGTADGTFPLADVRPGPVGSTPQQIVDVAGTAFFTADDGTYGREIWQAKPFVGGPMLVDDLDAGFRVDPGWTPTGAGYRSHSYQKGPGDGSAAQWLFPQLPPGRYRIAATWGAAAGRASNVPYRVSVNHTPVNVVRVDQRAAPGSFTFDGTTWETLGAFDLTAGELEVWISGAVDGSVSADAVYVERLGQLPPTWIVDSGDVGFSTTGVWADNYGGQGYGDDVHVSAPDLGPATATWTFANLRPGIYRVHTTWTAHENRATNAPYALFVDDVLKASVAVNQRLAPAGLVDNGSVWQLLETLSVLLPNAVLTVRLTNQADGAVIADAVRLELVVSGDGGFVAGAGDVARLLDKDDRSDRGV